MNFKNIFFRVLSIIVILMFVFIGFVWVSGATGYAVLSNSMSPTFDIGDVVFVKKIGFDALKVNDVVTVAFQNSDSTFTHRIVRIDQEKKQIYTKGDNSSTADTAPSDAKRILGKMWFSVPLLGYLSIALTNKTALVMLLSVLILLVIISSVISWYKKKKVRGDYDEKI